MERWSRDRAGWFAWAGSLALLAAGLVLPESGWVATLLAGGEFEAEAELARADGYYEGLLRASSPEVSRGEGEGPPPGWATFSDSGLVEEVDDYARRRLRRGVVARWNGATVRINALGYRSPEISRIKPARTFRVVVLGSSNTFGHGVEDGEAYPRLLETWLASRVPPGRRVEVVNLAVSGDAPTQRLHRLRTEVEALDPDWIFCDASALDLSLEEIHLRQVLQKKWAIPYQFVAQALREAGVSGVEPSEEFHARLSRFLRPALERTYAAWAAEARRLNTPLTVVLLPRADSKEPSSRLFEICREFADRQGLGLIDLSDTFDDFALDDYRVAPWDLHPNPLGHKLIARKLKLALLEIDEFESRLMGDAVNGYLTAK